MNLLRTNPASFPYREISDIIETIKELIVTFAKKRIRIVCPEGGSKILFPSYKSAEVYIEKLKEHARHPDNFQTLRIYYCKSCGGYHTTTSTENRLNRMSPKARAETIRLRRTQKYPLTEVSTKSPLNTLAAVQPTSIPPKTDLRSSPRCNHDNVIPGRIYRHFKGDYYQVLMTARHTETDEPLVIYQLLYHKKTKTWARPFKEFLSEVDHEKYPNVRQQYRFELQEPKNPTSTSSREL